jgi:hypothetical protein
MHSLLWNLLFLRKPIFVQAFGFADNLCSSCAPPILDALEREGRKEQPLSYDVLHFGVFTTHSKNRTLLGLEIYMSETAWSKMFTDLCNLFYETCCFYKTNLCSGVGFADNLSCPPHPGCVGTRGKEGAASLLEPLLKSLRGGAKTPGQGRPPEQEGRERSGPPLSNLSSGASRCCHR